MITGTPPGGETAWAVPPDERALLRELAARQAGYAALPVMATRRQQWLDLNDGRASVRPPFILEATQFMLELLPGGRYRCESEAGRLIEKELVRNTRPHEVYQDDRVVPPTLDVAWLTTVDEFGPDVSPGAEPELDAPEITSAHRAEPPVGDLAAALPRLREAVVSVDAPLTRAWQAHVSDVIGGVLPVSVRLGSHVSMTPVQRLVRLMGAMPFLIACRSEPDAVRAAMTFLRDNALSIMRQQEELGLLTLDNDHAEAWASSPNYTTRLPAPGFVPDHVRWIDRWGATNVQDAVGIGPSMASDLLYPHLSSIAAEVGQLYYGCCEAVHRNWDDIRALPHLRKVSISQWTDEAFMGEALRGTQIVFSRKPDPIPIALRPQIDEDGWRASLRATLEASRGCSTEILLREVYTLHGNPATAVRAVEIAREEIDRHWQP